MGSGVICYGQPVGPYETFTVEDFGNGRIALRGGRLNAWCSDQSWGLECKGGSNGRYSIGANEIFEVENIRKCWGGSARG